VGRHPAGDLVARRLDGRGVHGISAPVPESVFVVADSSRGLGAGIDNADR